MDVKSISENSPTLEVSEHTRSVSFKSTENIQDIYWGKIVWNSIVSP